MIYFNYYLKYIIKNQLINVVQFSKDIIIKEKFK